MDEYVTYVWVNSRMNESYHTTHEGALDENLYDFQNVCCSLLVSHNKEICDWDHNAVEILAIVMIVVQISSSRGMNKSCYRNMCVPSHIFVIAIYTSLAVCPHEYHTKQPHTSLPDATHRNALHRTATHCNALQHTATHCNTLQHTATLCNTSRDGISTRCHTIPRTSCYFCYRNMCVP